YSLLGAIDLRSGSMPEALSYFEKALALWQAVYGENDPHTAEGLGHLASFYLTDGQPQKAEPLFRKAAETFESVGGSNAFLCELYLQYAATEKMLGHKREAKQLEKKLQKMAVASAENTISRNVVDASTFRAPGNALRADVK